MDDCYEEIEIEAEAYTSIWLIQNLINRCNDIKVLKSVQIPELEYVLQNPHIFLVRNKQNDDILDDSTCLIRGKFKGTLIPESKKETLGAHMRRPYAMVFMLRVEKRSGDCSLNKEDCVMLDKAKKFLRKKKDVVYILKYDAGHGEDTYDETDLQIISEEIQQRIYGKNGLNRIFPNIFFMHDEQISIRIGICLHSSILGSLKQIFKKTHEIIQRIETEFTTLSSTQAFWIKMITDRLFRCLKVCSSQSLTSKNTVIETLSKVFVRCLQQFAGNRIWSLENISDVLVDKIRSKLNRGLIRINPPCPRYITRSKATQFKCYGASAIEKSRPKIAGNTTYVWNPKLASIVKAVLRMSLKVISKSVAENKDKLSGLCRNIEEEFTQRGDNVTLHEWKIVSERNHEIKGFGCIGDRITINVSRDDESCKTEVLKYLKQYLDVTNYTVSIECKKRTFTPFSNLEQGSRINRENAEKYGTLGMFFQDNEETYFFTTCAHVIGENAIAYSHTDNSRIGKNVFVFYSGSGMEDSQETHMDFSLIEVSPERNLTCTFGLKTLTGNFIEGHIFQGDLSEIRHRTLYKWGATKPYFRQGKCLGYVNDGAVLILQIDERHFAGPGDSGAITCIGDDPKLGLAAFVLVGGDIDVKTGIATYAVYKVSEAIDKVSELRREITPCLIPCRKSIPISESIRQIPPKAQKRKVEDDQSGSGQKRWSSSKLE